MMVRREHNKGVSKFRVDTDRKTKYTTTLSPARKEMALIPQRDTALKAEAQYNILKVK